MKIAIFGAGQLAMMMIEESADLGHEFIVIDPASRPPASKLAKHYMVEYNDEELLKFIASECDIASCCCYCDIVINDVKFYSSTDSCCLYGCI